MAESDSAATATERAPRPARSKGHQRAARLLVHIRRAWIAKCRGDKALMQSEIDLIVADRAVSVSLKGLTRTRSGIAQLRKRTNVQRDNHPACEGLSPLDLVDHGISAS
jgi:hypothetical protein